MADIAAVQRKPHYKPGVNLETDSIAAVVLDTAERRMMEEEEERNFDRGEYMDHTLVGIDLGLTEVVGAADRTGLDESSQLDRPWGLLHSSKADYKAGRAGTWWEAVVDCETTIS